VPIAPSATTTREARASRSVSVRVRLSAETEEGDGFGNEAMEDAPWSATAVGFALLVEDAPAQRSPERDRKVRRVHKAGVAHGTYVEIPADRMTTIH
jgi:hypothetical protein